MLYDAGSPDMTSGRGGMHLLNLGCGSTFHPRWTNIDLVASDPRVLQHDLRAPLPFADGSFDAVYHSHVLEHLTPKDGEALLRECRRVLVPGGILRIVVPDLEAIARGYLAALAAAERGGAVDVANLEWMKLELLDQMVRARRGGEMLAYVQRGPTCNRAFVEERVGSELFGDVAPAAPRPRSLLGALRPTTLRQRWREARRAFALKTARVVGGREARDALVEGLFRRSGELHLWMYDRVSLRLLLEDVGFGDLKVCAADESCIEGFVGDGLDTADGRVRKPDSLFVEARRPRATTSGGADAQR